VLAFGANSSVILRVLGAVAMVAGALALVVWFRQSKLIDR